MEKIDLFNLTRTSTEPVIVFSLGVGKELTQLSVTASALAKVFRTFGISCIQVFVNLKCPIRLVQYFELCFSKQ